MIDKFKTLITPILRKLPNLRRNQSQDTPVEDPLEDDKTIVVEDVEASSNPNLTPKQQLTENTPESHPFLHKAKNWLNQLFKKGNTKQLAHEAEEDPEVNSLVIKQADIGDLSLGIENEDQLEESPSGKLSRLKNGLIGWAGRKIIWIPVLASVLIGIGLTVTMMIHNRMSAQEQELQSLKIQAKKLEQENQVLKNSKMTIVETEAKPLAPVVATLPAVSRPASETASPKKLHGGDCVISDKTSVRESLKSCIEAFNASSN